MNSKKYFTTKQTNRSLESEMKVDMQPFTIIFFFRDFQLMTCTFNDRSLSSDQNTKWFLV